jgi:hypothetical protein
MEAQVMLDDRLLEDCASTFFGYGSYQALFWFIGRIGPITMRCGELPTFSSGLPSTVRRL